MRLGLFADPHYCNAEILCRTRRPSLSLNKIAEAMDAFRQSDVDLCICMGDLVDKSDGDDQPHERIREAMGCISAHGIPYYILMGNHDCAVFSKSEFAELTGVPSAPYIWDTPAHRLIFLDANYRSDGRHFCLAGVEWTDSNLPADQLVFLQRALAESSLPCIVLLHENLDAEVRADHQVKNADDVRRILEDSQKVALVIQGHYHKGADHISNRIRYLTLPAMCEGIENRYLILDI